MKIFFILLILLPSTVFAKEEIKKFKIEGMSLKDSVLDHFPGRDVVNNITSIYDHLSDEFHVSEIHHHGCSYLDDCTFEKYDVVSVVIKSKSEEILFPIYGMSGLIYYEKNIEHCYVEKNKIVAELQTIYNVEKVKSSHLSHPSDPTDQSHYEESKLYFDRGFARVTCYDMSDSMQITDALAVDIFYQEVDNWLNKIPSSI